MEATELLLEYARLVQGSFFEPNTKDMQGNPLTVKNGPNKGQPRIEYFVGLAYAKNDPRWPAIESAIKNCAAAHWPAYFPQGAAGPCTHPNFSMKVMDGDGMDGNGQPNSAKEGFAGCWVVKCSTGFKVPVYKQGRLDALGEFTEAEKGLVKLGYFYNVGVVLNTNNNPQRPGLYINMRGAQLAAYGTEIVPKAAFNAAAVFGKASGAPPPAGALPTPAGAAPAAAGRAASAPPPSAPSTTVSHGSAPPPNHTYMAPPPPAAAGPQMTPKAQGVTYEQYKAAGWSDEQLRSNGYMA